MPSQITMGSSAGEHCDENEPQFPYERPKRASHLKIAYLILAHGHPAQLARLVSTLPADAPVFIHFDGRASKSVYAAAQREVAAKAGSVEFVRRHRCRWGAPGIMY